MKKKPLPAEATLAGSLNAEETHFRESLADFRIRKQAVPPHIHNALIRWIVGHKHPGAFLTAVLRNNLMAACIEADDINIHHLAVICSWLYNYAPSACYGSPEKFEEWCIS